MIRWLNDNPGLVSVLLFLIPCLIYIIRWIILYLKEKYTAKQDFRIYDSSIIYDGARSVDSSTNETLAYHFKYPGVTIKIDNDNIKYVDFLYDGRWYENKNKEVHFYKDLDIWCESGNNINFFRNQSSEKCYAFCIKLKYRKKYDHTLYLCKNFNTKTAKFYYPIELWLHKKYYNEKVILFRIRIKEIFEINYWKYKRTKIKFMKRKFEYWLRNKLKLLNIFSI